MQEEKVVFSVLAVNHPGVLLRVAGLFSRRGFNIDSIVACSTETAEFSRLTLVVTGDEATFTQMIRQLLKLEDIVKVKRLKQRASAGEGKGQAGRAQHCAQDGAALGQPGAGYRGRNHDH